MTIRALLTPIIVWSKRPIALLCIAVLVAGVIGARLSGAGRAAAVRHESSASDLAAKVTQQYSGDGLAVASTESGARLRSEFQKLNGDATRGGLWVTSTAPGENAHLRMIATGIRRGDRVTTLARSGRVRLDAGRVTFTRPGLTEEYATSVDGVQQDFIVDQRPAGNGQLQVDLALTGAKAAETGAGALLTLDGSGRELAYARLHVADANGRALNASMDVVAPDRLAIRVDDANAVYPVRIDPTFSDADWVSLNPGVAGTNGTVSAIVTDASNNLYIGGTFTLVGSVLANNIAKWDGTEWTALGAGSTNGANNSVAKMVASGNDIYAGGAFLSAGGVTNTTRIAKWDGSAWSALGTGANNTVGALMMSGGTLYAGGSFTTIGGVAAGGLATWNGAAWSAFGGTGATVVTALAAIGTDVYMGCSCTTAGGVAINRIGKWSTTTSTWSALGAGNTSTVTALGVLGGELYAGASGNFTTTTGTPTGIAKWNPSTSQWLSVGTGTNFGGLDALLVQGGNIYIGGRFTTVNGVTAVNIAKWNGSIWSAVGTGTEGFLPGQQPTVNALAMVGTDLWAGGTFLSMGGSAAHGLGKWNGSAWSSVTTGLDNNVTAMVMSGTNLYVGGNFISAPNGVTVNRVAKWNGTTWSALGTGVNHLVNSMAVDASGNLYVGGRFSVAGGVSASLIAKWNGTAWSALGTGIAGNVAVTAIGVNSAGEVFAGGNFTGAGAGGVANTNRIAMWNGTTWSALGTGFADGLVNAIATIGTDVYVGGTFTLAGALPVSRIAKWTSSTSSWSALTTGVNSTVFALAPTGTDVYVAGSFTTAGAVSALRVAKWDGSAWSALAGGVNNTVNALAIDNGGRVYAGYGSTVGKWDGSAWSALGSGVSGPNSSPVSALAADTSGHLFVGGTLTTVGAGMVSAYIARADLNNNHAPVANAGVDQTVPATSGAGATATLNGTTSSDPDSDLLTYEWKNDASVIVGTTASLATVADFGAHTYTLKVTDPGGLTSTDTVNVTVADVFTISIVTPPLVPASYFQGQVVAAEYTCSDSAGLLNSCTSNAVSGNLDTSSPGTKSFTVTATNSRGDSSAQGRSYNVIAQTAQTITFTQPANVTYGVGTAALSATASSALSVTLTSNSASVCTVSGATATILAAGTCSITATQTGSVQYSAAAPVTRTFTVLTKALAATLTANSKVYDGTTAEPDASLSCALSGVIAADSANVVCTPTSGTFDSANVGSPRTVSATLTLSGTASANYTLGAAGTTTLSTAVTNAATSTTASAVYGQAGAFTTAAISATSSDSLSSPRGVAADANGNIYVADRDNNRVLFFPFGQSTATRVYGQGGSFTTNAAGLSAGSFTTPNRVTIDSAGLYVSDAGNNRVLFFPGTSTTPTRVYGEGGSFTSSTFNASGINADSLGSTRGIAVDAAGNVYIADAGNNRVLFYPAGTTTATRVYGQNGSFTTGLVNNTGGVAGVISAESLNQPNGLRLDTAGNLYVADQSNNRVLMYPAGQTTATVVYGQGGSFATGTANNGGVSASSLNIPSNLALDGGNNLYVAESNNNRVLFFPAGQTTATAVYGQAGSFTSNLINNTAGVANTVSATSLRAPNSVDLDFAGNIYISDATNNRVLRFTGSAPAITAAPLTITASSGTKTYGGTFSVTPSYSGFVNGETSSVLSSSATCTSAGSAASAAASNYATTCSGAAGVNYSVSYLAGALTVGTAPVTATLTAADKTYDGTTAEPNANMSCTLTGVLAADVSNVTCTATSGVFDGAGAGAHTVTATVTIGGTAGGNYTLGAAGTTSSSTSATAPATITAKSLTATITADNKTYDGTTTATIHPVLGAGVVGSEVVTVSGTGTFATKTAGVAKTVTSSNLALSGADAGNYVLSSSTAATTADIAKASATISVTGYSVTFDGSAHTATGTAMGVEGEDLSALLHLGGTTHTNAGDYPEDVWTFDGDTNYIASTGFASDVISKATSSTAISCTPTVTYTGAALEVCTATVTGAGGLNESVAVTYANNTNVGTASASATFAGDTNHDGSTATGSFSITKATSTTAISCTSTVTYTGAALEVCTATVTGVGGLNESVAVTYANNTNVGTASASATFAGDANHDGSTASGSFSITKATSTTAVSCTASVTFTGAAIEACTATVTGVGGLNESVAVTYASNVNVGTASASATFAGDANHDGSTASGSFSITKATSATAVSCTPSVTFTGAAIEACTATVTGVGGLSEAVAVTYTNNTNVGTASASATFAGDANHDGSTATGSFSITKATSTTAVSCTPTVTYTGAALEVCTATVTGVGGLNESVAVTYANNTTVGTASAGATFAGDANHDGSTASGSFSITKATSTTAVSCTPSVTFTGAAIEACTATVTGVGGLSEAVAVTYTNNTNVGTASASATFAGDANHDGSTATGSFSITKATSTTAVSCTPSVTYTSTAIAPCTATVTGVGGLSEAVAVTYTNNTNVGTASASATFAGDANHDGSTATGSFSITKATSTTAVSCTPSVTYTGAAQEVCTATVTGAGGLSEAVAVTYSSNTTVGTASASATFAGDTNHDGSTATGSFSITKATSTTAVSCTPSVTYTGAAQEVCTATVTGAGGLSEAVAVTYSSNTTVGTASASATFAGDTNHDGSTAAGSFSITKATSTTAISCTPSVTYTGAAQSACSATVTGAGGLSEAVAVTYANNTNVGTASASATFAGDANHDGSTATGSFSITKASSTTAISCTPSVTYTGAAQSACSATVTGAGGLSEAVAVTYANNTNVGTASASATFAGDANHDGSTATGSFSITKAALSVTANNASRAALAPNPAFTGTLTGVLGADGITATYSAPAVTLPGTYPIEPALVDPNGKLGNYAVTFTNGTLTVVDNDPPVVNVPAGITSEATSASGAVVTFADQVSAVDAVFGGVSATCAPASGTTFALGATTVTCTATDGVGNLGAASFIVTVVDTTAPTLSASDITVSASNAAGVAVNYAPIGHDTVSGDIASVCSPTSGTVFTIGSHPVSCTATDEAGNVSATASFTVTVLDGVAPVVSVPAAVTVEATSASGATVTFSATASDNVDETLTTTCTPASGSAFALGNTLVTCTATDSGGNTGTASFTVSVVDTTAPTLSLPTIAPVVSMTPTVVLTYTVTASDIVDGGVAATCSPASGSAFLVGNTVVTCDVVDAHGNAATGSFTIKVNDGVSPVVTVTPAGNRTVEATSSAGAVVTFAATATDNYDGARPVTCSPASGSMFPLGPATVVTCSATDSEGNVGTTTFTVTVVDTTPPVLTLPAPITQAASASTGAAVTYSASALDTVSGAVPVTCAPASGATFPVGLTTVNCSTSDARGNASSGSFTVTVTQAQSGIERFVAFSKDNTRLKSQVTVVSGDVGANQRRTATHGHRREDEDGDRDDITVQLGEKSAMLDPTSRVVGDTVNLQSKAKVYNVVENFLINREATVLGTITRPMAIPFLTMPTFPTVTAGTTAVTVKKNAPRTLAAGAYGAIKVENGATLILTGGLYQVLSIDVDPQGTILFRGASEVRVKTELETGSKAKLILDQTVSGLRASQIVFYVLGADANCSHHDRDDDGDDNGPASVHIGQQNVLQANIYAANGTVWLKSKTQATGAFIGQHLRIGEKVTLTLDSAFR